MKIKLSARVVALLAVSGVVVGVACSSTNTNPSPGSGGSSIVTSSVATNGSSGTGGNNASSSSGGTGGATTTTTTSGGATCYDGGAPMTNNDFINPCEPSATCQTFPNSTLPGLTADGGLPPLP